MSARDWFDRYDGSGAWFAVLDAARSPRVLPSLVASGARHQSLYEGWKAQELAEVAPYLTALPSSSPLWDVLLGDARGDAWGVFARADVSFEDLRRHMRRFLRVQAEDGRRMLFRWYDPRVLRAYLPTCTPAERETFHGPVRAFVVEGETPSSALRLTPSLRAPEPVDLDGESTR